ncbi:hypothetical protein ACOSQ3_033146 [Xanthoceras sorbifolium]
MDQRHTKIVPQIINERGATPGKENKIVEPRFSNEKTVPRLVELCTSLGSVPTVLELGDTYLLRIRSGGWELDPYSSPLKNWKNCRPSHRIVPVRRSQKLSDKITTLQKLVSPYGKTDTASVLQEANLYIKLLQEQIQNLFQILCSSYNSVTTPHSQEMGEEKSDLRSRGLCLVPISVTQKLTKNQELLIDSHSMSRKTTMP